MIIRNFQALAALKRTGKLMFQVNFSYDFCPRISAVYCSLMYHNSCLRYFSSTLVLQRSTETTVHVSTYNTVKTRTLREQLGMPASTPTWASSRVAVTTWNLLDTFSCTSIADLYLGRGSRYKKCEPNFLCFHCLYKFD